MIENLSNIKDLLASGHGEVIVSRFGQGEKLLAIKIHTGHVLARDWLYMPVVDGKTVLNVFGDARRERYDSLLAAAVNPTGEFADAVFVAGFNSYYHFIVQHLPNLLFLRAHPGKERVSLVTLNGWPKSTQSLVADLMPTFSGGRAVDITKIETGDYAVRNVIYPATVKPEVAVLVNRQHVVPFVLQRNRILDPIGDLGSIKLFVRRESAGNGRNLSNQAEVEAWFVHRGYTSINPGTLTMEQQIILFSRATHIAGVEGAAMTNILFAINAVDVTMIASPATSEEKFFSALAKHCGFTFRTVYGEISGTEPAARSANFELPMAKLTVLGNG